MNGNDLHQSVRRMLHDQGLALLSLDANPLNGYTAITPEWSDSEITLRLNAARDVLYTRLVEGGRVTTVNQLVRSAVATHGTSVPSDFWRLIIGYQANGAYVLAQDISLSLAMAPAGLDTVYVAGGLFLGTADKALYYGRPQDDLSPAGGTFTEFSDGVMNAIALLAVIELTMGEVDDAADRLDDLYIIYQAMEASFE